MQATIRFSLILGLAAALAPAAAAQALKVGVFDAQLVSESTDMGKRIQTALTAFTQRKENEIAEMQQKVSAMRKELSQQSLSLSAERRVALEKDIQRNMLDLQSAQESASRELELEYTTATSEFREKLVSAVGAFGQDEGFSLILDRSQVAWSDQAIDVTSAIVDRFNRMFPAVAEE
jgi:outer membrane protein